MRYKHTSAPLLCEHDTTLSTPTTLTCEVVKNELLSDAKVAANFAVPYLIHLALTGSAKPILDLQTLRQIRSNEYEVKFTHLNQEKYSLHISVDEWDDFLITLVNTNECYEGVTAHTNLSDNAVFQDIVRSHRSHFFFS